MKLRSREWHAVQVQKLRIGVTQGVDGAENPTRVNSGLVAWNRKVVALV